MPSDTPLGRYRDYLALLGRFYEVPETLFIHRDHPLRSTRVHPRISRPGWFDPSKEGQLVFPIWRLLVENSALLSRSGLPRKERMQCWLEIFRWALNNRKKLRREVRDYLRLSAQKYIP